MNQSERIKLQEIKLKLAEIIGVELGCSAFIMSSGEFSLDHLLSMLQIIKTNTTYIKYDNECLNREKAVLKALLKGSTND